ncbi:hypothetical protein [Lysobacter sp. P5_B9]
MNVHTMSIVVDLRELEALRRSRVPAAGLADEYLRELVPAGANAGPALDFWAGTPLVSGQKARLH